MRTSSGRSAPASIAATRAGMILANAARISWRARSAAAWIASASGRASKGRLLNWSNWFAYDQRRRSASGAAKPKKPLHDPQRHEARERRHDVDGSFARVEGRVGDGARQIADGREVAPGQHGAHDRLVAVIHLRAVERQHELAHLGLVERDGEDLRQGQDLLDLRAAGDQDGRAAIQRGPPRAKLREEGPRRAGDPVPGALPALRHRQGLQEREAGRLGSGARMHDLQGSSRRGAGRPARRAVVS